MKTPPERGLKRMMGLEPTTFCMATGPVVRTIFALFSVVGLNLDPDAEPSMRTNHVDLRSAQARLGTSA
jgi:hypothetical protein